MDILAPGTCLSILWVVPPPKEGNKTSADSRHTQLLDGNKRPPSSECPADNQKLPDSRQESVQRTGVSDPEYPLSGRYACDIPA